MGQPIRDLTGMEFGRLRVTAFAGVVGEGLKRRATWHCRCTCGGTKTIRGNNLTCGSVVSCGCLRNERAGRKSGPVPADRGARDAALLLQEVWR